VWFRFGHILPRSDAFNHEHRSVLAVIVLPYAPLHLNGKSELAVAFQRHRMQHSLSLREEAEPDDELLLLEAVAFFLSRWRQLRCDRQRPSGASFCQRGSPALPALRA
jgi:hypothetical protein